MDAYFARQPILDADMNVYGYELLFRSHPSSTASGVGAGPDGDSATTSVLESMSWSGMDKITGGKLAFVNFTENLLVQGVATLYPKEYLVVEVLEDIHISDVVLDAVKALKSKGYMIAMDDYIYNKRDIPLLQLCDIIKVEVDSSDESYANIEKIARVVDLRKCRLLAEKVETQEVFEQSRRLGCTLFQGFFFARPKVITSRTVSPLKVNQLRLLREIYKKDADFDKLASIIKNDVGLTYKTLRLVNSAYYGLQHEVRGINQAIAILGLNEMRKWLTYTSLDGLCEDKPTELVIMSLTRACFCEKIAKLTGKKRDADAYFLAGLFSLLDAMMDVNLEHCLSGMRVPIVTKRALLEDGNHGRHVLELFIAMEHGNWNWAAQYSEILEIEDSLVSDTYMEAVTWAHSFI